MKEQTNYIVSTDECKKPSEEVIVEIENLYISFGKNQVLNGMNLWLKKGETLVVLGKSGSGKSVLIKCLVGLDRKSVG